MFQKKNRALPPPKKRTKHNEDKQSNRVQNDGYKAAQGSQEKKGWTQWELQLKGKYWIKIQNWKITDMKNTLEEIKSKGDDVGKQISDMENKVVKITKLKQKKF